MIVGIPCGNCKHIRPNKDGWQCVCDAFPDGIPDDNLFYKSEEELLEMKVCNNGIGYEPAGRIWK